ncbi:Uncharacterised protein [Bordetella ansorpii]|uniref:Uncharacterized protein n=1 Tax=Bordetella ansorpii TaxID=288768 RepID=A0A157Q9S8_9BORD|nr:hypothetical protein [Bordetella ansorpii]SAI42316.1 Uncharacterised protein [Bordetella ansorpii]
MQWIKYLMPGMGIVFLVLIAWMIYTKDYNTAAALAVSVVLTAIMYFVFFHPYFRQEALANRLEQEGSATQALILSVKDTGKYLNEVPIMRVSVRYTVNGQERTGEVKQPIPYQSLAAVQAGKRIGIRLDPRKEGRFVLKL